MSDTTAKKLVESVVEEGKKPQMVVSNLMKDVFDVQEQADKDDEEEKDDDQEDEEEEEDDDEEEDED